MSGGLRDQSVFTNTLLQGRVAIVLEPTASNLSKTNESLDKAAASAGKQGMWARMLAISTPLVTVGPKQLPKLVPQSNIPSKHVEEVAEETANGQDDPERVVAERKAAHHGLYLKVIVVRVCAGYNGVFPSHQFL